MIMKLLRNLRFSLCGNFYDRYEQEIAIFETDFGRLCLLAALVILFAVVPFVSGPYTMYLLIIIAITSIAALGLNILVGFTGQLSLGHGAFFGVGAYTAAILAADYGWPFLLCVLAGGVVTALVGIGFGLPSGRLKGLYLTIATLAGQFIIEHVLVQWESVTKGVRGIVLPFPTLFGFFLDGDVAYFYVTFIALALMTFIAVNIMRSRYGRAFIAIRDNDRAAEGMGIPIFRYKLLSFAISSFYAGFAGALWAFYMVSITAEPFNLMLSVEYIAMIIIGGLGSIPGAIFGATFIVMLNEILRIITQFLMNTPFMAGIELTLAPLRELAFGLAIVLFIIFEPRGLAELWRIVKSNFRLWPFSY